jgi:hypothetical protein
MQDLEQSLAAVTARAMWREAARLSGLLCIAMHVSPVANAAPLTCADLASNDPLEFELSYEGSWSFLRFNRMCEGCDPCVRPPCMRPCIDRTTTACVPIRSNMIMATIMKPMAGW